MIGTLHRGVLISVLTIALPAGSALAQQDLIDNTSEGADRIGPGSFDQTLGRTFVVDAASLPKPYATPTVSNGPRTLPYSEQVPIVPPGFIVTRLARLQHPRRMLVLPDGNVLVAEQNAGALTLIRYPNRPGEGGDREQRGVSSGALDPSVPVERFASKLEGPYGLALREGEILVADQRGIWSLPYPASGPPSPKLITKDGVFGSIGGHSNRPLAIDPRTGTLFVGVGSIGNIDVEPPVKATIQAFNADGSNQRTYAAGARNPTGLAVHPQSGELYALVQERDGLGNRLVPDYLTHVKDGAFYGWPYAYLGQNPQPGFANRAPDRVKATVAPDLLFEAHSSTLDLAFYTGDAFPEKYRNGAFVALKGSWNRTPPTGYKVVFVPFEQGRPTGSYENFMVGFWTAGQQQAQVWGRPASLAVARDGALLIGDDLAGTVWRVAAGRKEAQAPEIPGPSGHRSAQAGAPSQSPTPPAPSPPTTQVPSSDPTQPNLTERLKRSDGVITPPANIDPEISVPAPNPNPNTTPVIPPPGSPGGNPDIRPK